MKNFKRYRNVVSDFSVGRQPGLRSLLSFMLGAALLCVTTAQRDDISRPNFGIYFHEVSEFELQTETWMNVFTFELPTTRKQSINDSHTVKLSERLSPVAKQLYDSAQLQADYLSTTLQEIEGITPELPLPLSRMGRGLCAFCGNILKYLFNLATEDDVKRAV